jgi:hypothetical protein
MLWAMSEVCLAGNAQLHGLDAMWNTANQVVAVTNCKAAPSVLNIQPEFN